MKYIINSINCSGYFVSDYPNNNIVQNDKIEVEIYAFNKVDHKDVKIFSCKVNLPSAYALSLNEIKDKAIEIAKENFEKVISAG
ncbi:hypothetical protein [Xenorhabdus bovienii]|uniref:Uncharacterized protein n=1 Tax=Xenorhabdus bovienii str. Intermedium TaxID=1379677 RepID=A0A077QFF7_XENBV|nr:hypothetical protein [Xenorhabdus bovienii]CDH34782.1 hypothetical protein XBI1_540007 [Xenorhabdus bovienii str. Intermedium]